MAAYRLQFKFDALPNSYLRSCEVWNWVASQGVGFAVTERAIRQCGRELYPEYEVARDEQEEVFWPERQWRSVLELL